MSTLKLLIVEDDPLFGGALKEVLDGAGYSTRLAENGKEALDAIIGESFDLVLQDIKLPDADGLNVLKEILNRQPHCGSIVMTGYGTIERAVEAMKMGAFEFLTKPFPMEILLLKLERFLQFRKAGKKLNKDEAEHTPFPKVITRSPAMLAILEIAAEVAKTSATVLLQGESGTGKDLMAEAIHGASQRHDGPYIPVNCAAIPPTLIESELFGVERGAYTGADKSRPGYIEMASGGTLFLDEIGELPLDLQGKLLRVIEEKGVARVGGTCFRSIDFRLISATNCNLANLVKQQKFRRDLYFRLNVVPICLPPLRERKDDIPLLLAHLLNKFSVGRPACKPCFTPEALELLYDYSFPGNIREMYNLIERISLLHPGEKILRHHLPPELQQPGIIGSQFESFSIGKPLREAVAEYEKRYIEKVVHYAGGRKALAAKILGLSRKVLWEKLKKQE